MASQEQKTTEQKHYGKYWKGLLKKLETHINDNDNNTVSLKQNELVAVSNPYLLNGLMTPANDTLMT